MPATLEGRRALVTGGVGGIGTAIVRALAAAGAGVAVHHLGEQAKATAVAKALPHAVVVEGDLRDEAAVEALVTTAAEGLGGLDLVVNNAAIMTEEPFLSTPLHRWRDTLDVNLTGPFLVARAALPRMATGALVNVSSQLAFKGAAGLAAYCTTKAGIVGLTRVLAREFGPDIRVNAVAPGPVETPLIAPYADDAWRAARTASLVTGRLARPEEIADVVTFLASDAASQFHGQTLHCNGGGVLA